jgi:hypothetical protein
MSGAARKADSKKRLMLDVRSRLTGDRRRRPSSRRAKEIAATSGDPSHRYSETREQLFRHGQEIGFSTQSQSLRMARAKGSRSWRQGPLRHRRGRMAGSGREPRKGSWPFRETEGPSWPEIGVALRGRWPTIRDPTLSYSSGTSKRPIVAPSPSVTWTARFTNS